MTDTGREACWGVGWGGGFGEQAWACSEAGSGWRPLFEFGLRLGDRSSGPSSALGQVKLGLQSPARDRRPPSENAQPPGVTNTLGSGLQEASAISDWMLDCQLDAAERAQAQAQAEPKNDKPRRKFVGFSEQVRLKQEAQRNRTGPDPWLTRKVSTSSELG